MPRLSLQARGEKVGLRYFIYTKISPNINEFFSYLHFVVNPGKAARITALSGALPIPGNQLLRLMRIEVTEIAFWRTLLPHWLPFRPRSQRSHLTPLMLFHPPTYGLPRRSRSFRSSSTISGRAITHPLQARPGACG